jgi:polysaccharide biosynthesis PFTS motif protein
MYNSRVTYELKKKSLRNLIDQRITKFELPDALIEELVESISAFNISQRLQFGHDLIDSSVNIPENVLTKKKSLNHILKTSSLTLYALSKIIFSRRVKATDDGIALVYSLPFDHIPKANKKNQVSDFIDKKLLAHNIDLPSSYLIQSGKLLNRKNTNREKYVTYIGIEILIQLKASKLNKLNTVAYNYLKWLRLVCNDNLFLLIGPEFIIDYDAFSKVSKDEYRLLITTQSQILKTPISFKLLIGARKLMFWYSNNSETIKKRSDKKIQDTDYSYLKNDHIDVHFVWTVEWGRVLTKITQKPVFAIGPIIFKELNLENSNYRSINSQRKITVFDVTPKEKAFSESFYSPDNLIIFIQNIFISANKSNPEVIVQLKNKRKFKKDDSVKYRKFLKSMKGKISFISPKFDMESLILGSDLIICVPYTSPALIAANLNIPAVYYWPDNGYLLKKEIDGIEVLIGAEDLKAFISKSIGYP